MKELFDHLRHVKPTDLRLKEHTLLLDTCFLVHALLHKEKELKKLLHTYPVGITTFNLAELDHIKHKVDSHVRERARKVLQENPLIVVEIPVHPGNRTLEENYIKSVDKRLLIDIPDPSDAVLMAAAIQTLSTVLTKDRHHLFTTRLENYIRTYGISVYKEFHEVPGWNA